MFYDGSYYSKAQPDNLGFRLDKFRKIGTEISDMVLYKKPKLNLEELQYKAIIETAVRRTNKIVDRWKDKDNTLSLGTEIDASKVESVFLNFLRRPLFPDQYDFRDFVKNIQVFINAETKHIADIVDMSTNLRESNITFNRVLSPAEIKLEEVLNVIGRLNFKALDKEEEIYEAEIEPKHG